MAAVARASVLLAALLHPFAEAEQLPATGELPAEQDGGDCADAMRVELLQKTTATAAQGSNSSRGSAGTSPALSCAKTLAILCTTHQAVFADMADGDQKLVEFSGSTMTITPSGSDEQWIVNADLDREFCTASVDFNVPGKPDPPAVALLATLWSTTAWGPTGVQVTKMIVEFSDPSGTLADANLPLNHWVQLGTMAPCS